MTKDDETSIIKKVRVSVLASLLTILISLSAAVGTYSILQYRVQVLEKGRDVDQAQISALESQLSVIRETLVEIKADVRFLREDFRRRMP